MRAPETNDLALVLSGGGARAAYQVGVLRAIAEWRPDLRIPILTGVSAGAINTLFLASHPGPLRLAAEHLRGQWLRLTSDQVSRVRPLRFGVYALNWLRDMLLGRKHAGGSLHGLMNHAPLRQFLSEAIDVSGVRRNLEAGQLSAVAISATCYATGQTVTFVQAQEGIPMWQRHMRIAVRAELTIDHVLASSSIPIVFPAVKIGNQFYGDGSVRQAAPLAPAIHLGARRLIAIAMRSAHLVPPCVELVRDSYPSTAEVLGLLLNTIFQDSLDADAERLERINRLLALVPPDRRRDASLNPVELLVIRPSQDVAQLAQGLAPRLPRSMQFVLRALGGGDQAGSLALLSYLLFEPEFTGMMMDLGYEDAKRKRAEIERFLSGEEVREVGSKA